MEFLTQPASDGGGQGHDGGQGNDGGQGHGGGGQGHGGGQVMMEGVIGRPVRSVCTPWET